MRVIKKDDANKVTTLSLRRGQGVVSTLCDANCPQPARSLAFSLGGGASSALSINCGDLNKIHSRHSEALAEESLPHLRRSFVSLKMTERAVILSPQGEESLKEANT